jgi:hypothetical protein
MQFVRVKEAPAELRKDEYLINAPTFLDEVRACFNKRPRNEVMSINYLRELVAAVGAKYLPETFNAMTDVNVSQFKGTPCTSEVEANEILLKLFKREYPAALDAFVEYHIKKRPNGTKTILYLGTGDQSSVFLKLGFQEVLLKDLYKEEKPKKTVGKPAITKEEADKKSETVV